MPGPVRKPVELNPAAMKKFCRLGASPKWYTPSGVKLSGPPKNNRMPAVASAGIRCMAIS